MLLSAYNIFLIDRSGNDSSSLFKMFLKKQKKNIKGEEMWKV